MQRLGWANVPAVVKEADDRTLLTLALIENLQRDDLSPIDEALGYQRLMDEFQVAQQKWRGSWAATAPRWRTRCGCSSCPRACARWCTTSS